VEDMRCPGVKPQMQQCAMPITCEVLILPVGYDLGRGASSRLLCRLLSKLQPCEPTHQVIPCRTAIVNTLCYKERLICPFSCRIVILLQIIVHGTIEEGACKPFELWLGVALEFLDVIISRVCSVCVLRRVR